MSSNSGVGFKNPPPFNPGWYDPLSPTDRKVLYYLMDEAEKRGTQTFQVYIIDIGKAVGISRRMASHALSRLQERGYILRTEKRDERGSKDANEYTILNADRNRREKIREVALYANLPETSVIDYVYWLHHHRDKYAALDYPTVDEVAYLAHCPAPHAAAFVEACVRAGILDESKVTF